MSALLAIILSSISISVALSMLVSKRKIIMKIGISMLAVLVLVLTGCSYHQPSETSPNVKKDEITIIKEVDDEVDHNQTKEESKPKQIADHKEEKERTKPHQGDEVFHRINPYVIRDDFKNNITEAEKHSFHQVIDAIMHHEESVTLQTNMYSNILIDYLIDSHPYMNLVKETQFDDTYQCIHIQYVYNEKEHQEKLALINDFFQNLLNNNIKKGMNDVDKTLAVYQAVGSSICYDYDWYERFCETDDPYHFPEISVLEAIETKKGVCHTYTYLMQFALQQLYIEALPVEGVSGDRVIDSHMWLMVKLDDAYYHLDPTWDDQDDKGIGLCYFGLTDQQRKEQGFTLRSGCYNVEMGDIVCTSKRFAKLQTVTSYRYLKDHQWQMTTEDGQFIYDTCAD